MEQHSVKHPLIALIRARWHGEIVDQGADAFLSSIKELGHEVGQVEVFDVPGALEIPLQAQCLARTKRFSAIVAMAFVVDGGIYRHDFVAGTVIDALMKVQLGSEVPILSTVLTPQCFHDHAEHRNFFRSHFRIKGREAASACAATIANLRSIASGASTG